MDDDQHHEEELSSPERGRAEHYGHIVVNDPVRKQVGAGAGGSLLRGPGSSVGRKLKKITAGIQNASTRMKHVAVYCASSAKPSQQPTVEFDPALPI